MNNDTYDQLISDAADLYKKSQKQQQAVEIIKSEMAKLESAGSVLKLTDEELRMLKSFRKFKNACKQGQVFKWQTGPAEEKAIDPQDAF